jgi:hypothetical protein
MITPISSPPMRQWTWRVAPPELATAVTSTQAAVAAVPPRPVSEPPAQVLAAHPAVFHPMVANAIAARSALAVGANVPPSGLTPVVHNATPPGVAGLAAATATPRDFTPVTLRADVTALHVQELGQCSAPQTVTSKNFVLSFSYCLVNLTRDWLDEIFLLARNWYLPHTKAGEIASGTGTGSGPFEVMPVAAIVVKDLVIEADWSHDDIAILHNSVNFGPFSLVGRTIDEAKCTLSCEGMQMVAWVFEPMPCLPPCSDPSISDKP